MNLHPNKQKVKPKKTNGKIFGSGHGHLDHRTSWVRNDEDRQPRGYDHIELECLSIPSWMLHQRLQKKMILRTPTLRMLREMNKINRKHTYIFGNRLPKLLRWPV